ncbi:MAG TPA: hypothetical protein VI749_03400 [Candidatus Omnitrophota bacterium]|nr:hypothetical protein [Candidatus Omnitrophota bacterium]
MKKFFLTAVTVGLSLVLVAPTYAEKKAVDPDRNVDTELSRVHKKFRRGAINLVTFPLEIPKQAKGVIDEGGESIPKRAALVVPGILKGIGYSAVRLVSGAWDLFTFNVNIPKDHKPVLEPEFVWEGAEEK